ncbi:3'-5' exonuclease [Atopobium fossor]|uniref:3'-5' exonuclease n=1 Tax=Atopobium fossor TaxID=39487 RepID=UPI000481CCBA|nr:DNA polymerase [Atopobium fossor]
MNLSEALERANAFSLPGFFMDDATLTADRAANEDAISQLLAAWRSSFGTDDPFDFEIVRALADRNRATCDSFGIERLQNVRGTSLAPRLSDEDLIRGVAAMQHRNPKIVAKEAGLGLNELTMAYLAAPISGMVVGIDIETTSREPDRGYIVNVGLEFMQLAADTQPTNPYFAYCGLPNMYKEKGVPLAHIHHISWSDVEDKTPFREDKKMQAALLATLTRFPYMAHNAAFEDSWFMLHIDGYAEARKEGKIVPIDTRDICRRVDPETKILPHEQRPASLESWARRRKTLAAGQSEKHLGLEDVDLMFRTVQAEFTLRNMFSR